MLGLGDWKRWGSGRLADGPAVVVSNWAHLAPGLQPSSFSPSPTPPQAINDLTFTEEVDMMEMEKALQEQDYIFGNYIERLWAYLTIEQLLEKR